MIRIEGSYPPFLAALGSSGNTFACAYVLRACDGVCLVTFARVGVCVRVGIGFPSACSSSAGDALRVRIYVRSCVRVCVGIALCAF